VKLTAAQLSLDGMASPEPETMLVDGEAPGPVLTEEQELSVARRSEPLLLSAAAGSGKTSVLVERFVRTVREDGVAPGRILAITFTERAAGELRERVRTRLLELGEREAARDTEAAFVGTFHGFCARLLRAHPLLAGLEPEFAILDEGLAGRLRQRAFRAALREFVHGERPQAVDLLAAYGPDRVRAMIEGIHAQLRSRGARLPRLPAAEPMLLDDDTDAAAASVLLDELLVGFTDAYEELKRERGAVDFDDLELCARELLDGHESVRAAWSERFQLLMVDEFQDTNPRQLAILRALDRGNLFTVGDEHQSIYGFRHADVSLFRARRAELAGRGGSLALRRNFRSRPQLLEVVNAVFAERFA
jgi:ATP-dependent exoDNAse (exonuclease V) beta subunit